MAVEHVVELAVIGMNERHAIAPRRQRLAGPLERLGIAVEPEDSTCAGFEKSARMPAEADRAIDEQAAAFRAQLLEHLGRENGNVRDQMPYSESARASSSVYGSR